MPFVDLLHFKNNSTDNYMSQKMSEKVRRKKIRENISKNQLKKIPKSLNLGKKSQNPEKNCRDFLIPKIFVRFFQSNLPLGITSKCFRLYSFGNVIVHITVVANDYMPTIACNARNHTESSTNFCGVPK